MDIKQFMQKMEKARPITDDENISMTREHILANNRAVRNTKGVDNLTEIMICIEEMSELSQVLTECLGQDMSWKYMDEETRMHVLEEMADVYIMMLSMEMLTEKNSEHSPHFYHWEKQLLMKGTMDAMAEMTKTLCKAVRKHIPIDSMNMKDVISKDVCFMKQRVMALLPVFGFTVEDLQKAMRVKQDNYKLPFG